MTATAAWERLNRPADQALVERFAKAASLLLGPLLLAALPLGGPGADEPVLERLFAGQDAEGAWNGDGGADDVTVTALMTLLLGLELAHVGAPEPKSAGVERAPSALRAAVSAGVGHLLARQQAGSAEIGFGVESERGLVAHATPPSRLGRRGATTTRPSDLPAPPPSARCRRSSTSAI